jgi:hypothetical protein
VEQLLFRPDGKFAIMPIFLYQRSKDGNPQHDWNQWVSFGARPEYFFTKNVSLAFEAGFACWVIAGVELRMRRMPACRGASFSFLSRSANCDAA